MKKQTKQSKPKQRPQIDFGQLRQQLDEEIDWCIRLHLGPDEDPQEANDGITEMLHAHPELPDLIYLRNQVCFLAAKVKDRN
jgi:hypothetical protein